MAPVPLIAEGLCSLGETGEDFTTVGNVEKNGAMTGEQDTNICRFQLGMGQHWDHGASQRSDSVVYSEWLRSTNPGESNSHPSPCSAAVLPQSKWMFMVN
jgi:hypothetical protein